MRLWTQPFADWVAPNRHRADLPRLFLGLITVEFGFMLGGVVATLLIGAMMIPGPGGWSDAITDAPVAAAKQPLRTILNLMAFVGLGAGTVLAARWLQDRPWQDLLGIIDLRHLRAGALIAAAVGALPLLLYDTSGLMAHQPFGTVLFWAPLGLIAIAVQTGAEELFFRGYLQTQLAARFDNPVAWMVVPSAYFAALHIDLVTWLETGRLSPPEIEMALWAFTFGLLCADLTRVTGGLMAAWGWHIGLNAWGTIGIAGEGDLSDIALYVIPVNGDAMGDPMTTFSPFALSAELLLLIITWAWLRLWLTRDD